MITFPELETLITNTFKSPFTNPIIQDVQGLDYPTGWEMNCTLAVLEETTPIPPHPFVLDFALGQKSLLINQLANRNCVIKTGTWKLDRVILESNAVEKQPTRWLFTWELTISVTNNWG